MSSSGPTETSALASNRSLASRALVGASCVALVTLVAALAAVGGVEAPPDGLPDPGEVVRWGLPVAELVGRLASTVCVGLLVLRSMTLALSRPVLTELSPLERRALTYAGVAGLLWALSSATAYMLGFANLSGMAPTTAMFWSALPSYPRDIDTGRILAEALALVVLATLGAFFARGPGMAAAATIAALCALILPTYTGHSASSPNHDTATVAMVFHVAGIAAWAGGLVGLLLLRSHLGTALTVTARSFSTLAGVAYAMVAMSGLVNAVVRVTDWSQVSTPYLVLLAGKVLAFAALGLAGWAQRQRLLHGLDTGTDTAAAAAAFTRLLVIELFVIAVAMGLSVVLTQIPATTT